MLCKNLRATNKELEKRLNEKNLLEEKFRTENESLKRQLTFFKDVDKTLKKAQDMNSKRICKKPTEECKESQKCVVPGQADNLNIVKAVKRRDCTSCRCHSTFGKITPDKKKLNPSFIKTNADRMTPIVPKDVRSSLSPFLKKKNTIESKSTNVTPTMVSFILYRI
jgi:hypothetical protein